MKLEQTSEKSETNTDLQGINPTDANFDFELWSKAVKDQMMTALQKTLNNQDEDSLLSTSSML